jgi:hypothetical protein
MMSPYVTALKLAEAVVELDRQDATFAQRYGLWDLVRNYQLASVERQIEDAELDE